jgi:branched-chain amino acid transport system substrate-binding protein
MITIARTLLIAAIATLLLACSDDDDDRDEPLTVALGIVHSTTGDGGNFGLSSMDGIELALQELEASNSGIEFETSVINDMSSIDEGVAAFNSLIEDGVDVIIGPSLSRIAFESLPIAEQESVPTIAAITAAAGIAEIGDYIFRLALSEVDNMPLLISYVSDQMPVSQGVLFYDGSDAYSLSAADGMREGMSAIGAFITLEVDVSRDGAVDEAIADPNTADADVFLISTFSQTAAPVLVALREAGLTGTVIGGAAFAAQHLLDDVGADGLEGTYFASTWHPDAGGDEGARFVSAYREEYGRTPENNAALGYAAVQVLVDALQRARSTEAEDLRDALAETDGLNTVLGPLSMSPEGAAEFEPVFQQ